MARYLILNSIVTLISLISIYRHRANLNQKSLVATIFVLLFMTAVFDSFIIYNQIVAYNQNYIVGNYVGLAPVEDFAYAIVSALVVSALWERYEKK